MNEMARSLLGVFHWQDAADVVIVAVFLYWIMVLIKGTRAVQMLVGLAVFLGLYWVADRFGLHTIHAVLSTFLGSIFLVIVVLFQNEIRRGLVELGRSPLFSRLAPAESEMNLEELVRAVVSLASRRIGALIVLERRTGLREFIESGVRVDASFSKQLIESIFQGGSPLHDGAVIVSRGRIAAAGSLLPLTVNPDVSRALGTRHRAALGMSEASDAVVLVVSEETGVVSLAVGGTLDRDLDAARLRKRLGEMLGRRGGPGGSGTSGSTADVGRESP